MLSQLLTACAYLLGVSSVARAQVRTSVLPLVAIPRIAPHGLANFTHPVGGTLLNDGTIAIADAATLTITYFDAQGNRLRAVGGRGRNPGRFDALSWIGQCGRDSIVALDFVLERLSIFNPHGALARTIDLQRGAAVAACSDNMSFVLLERPTALPYRPTRAGRIKTHVDAVDRLGKVQREIGMVNGYDYLPGVGLFQPLPLRRFTRLALTSNYAWLGTQDRGRVIQVELATGHRKLVDVGTGAHRATWQNLIRATAELTLLQPDTVSRVMASSRLLKAGIPIETLPYSAIFAAAHNSLWVVFSAPGDEATGLRLFTVTGKMGEQLTIPADVQVLDIVGDRILGIRWEGRTPSAIMMWAPRSRAQQLQRSTVKNASGIAQSHH